MCGDAALLFDPRSVEAITEAIDGWLSDEQLRRRLGDAGAARARQLSRAKTAELTA